MSHTIHKQYILRKHREVVASLLSGIFQGMFTSNFHGFTGACKTIMNTVTKLQDEAVRASLGLSSSASTLGTLTESHLLPMDVFKVRVSLRDHLLHITRHANLH